VKIASITSPGEIFGFDLCIPTIDCEPKHLPFGTEHSTATSCTINILWATIIQTPIPNETNAKGIQMKIHI